MVGPAEGNPQRQGLTPRRSRARYPGAARRGCPAPPQPVCPRRPCRPIAWAELLRRTFQSDVLTCPRCGGTRRVVAVVLRSATTRAIPTSPPGPSPSPGHLPAPECRPTFETRPGPVEADVPDPVV